MNSSTTTCIFTCLSTVVFLVGCGDSEPESAAALSATDSSMSCLADMSQPGAGVKSAANYHQEVWIEGGNFTKGSDVRYREEAPAHQQDVAGFWMDIHEVTNQQFAVFVKETNYVTTAENKPLAANYPDIPADKLQAGSAMFIPPVNFKAGMQEGHWTQWWQFVEGASWRHPEGPQSDLEGREQHPVVHVSYLDAAAYAEWAGRSIPDESQWELAAQGAPGSYGTQSQHPGRAANTWQGFFPMQDNAADGHAGAAPVGCYPAGKTGLYDMIGNVWEWVNDEYQEGHTTNAKAPSTSPVPVRVIKGGSHLCAENYCRRNAPPARQPQEEDFGVAHLGFRTIRTVK